MRFDVAFTHTATTRHLVGPIADALSERLSRDRVLFTDYHQEDIYSPQGGIELLEWYEHQSRIVVVALSADYFEQNSWTTFEWPIVLGLTKEGTYSPESVFLLRTDDTLPRDIPGLGNMALGLDIRNVEPEKVADLIMSRLARLYPDAARGGSVEDGNDPPIDHGQKHLHRESVSPTARIPFSGPWSALTMAAGPRLIAANGCWVEVRAVSGETVENRSHLGAEVTSLVLTVDGRGAVAIAGGTLRSALVRPDGRVVWHSAARELGARECALVAAEVSGEQWAVWASDSGELLRYRFDTRSDLQPPGGEKNSEAPHLTIGQSLVGEVLECADADALIDSAITDDDALTAVATKTGDRMSLDLYRRRSGEVQVRRLEVDEIATNLVVARPGGGRGPLGPVLAEVAGNILMWDWTQGTSAACDETT